MTGSLVTDMTARRCAEPDDPYTAIRGPMADPRPDRIEGAVCPHSYALACIH